MSYLILQNSGHNRVYYNSADKLALAELKIACSRLSVKYNKVEIEEIDNKSVHEASVFFRNY